MVKAIPEGYTTLTSYLIVDNIADALAFYEKAFDAKVKCSLKTPDGAIGHAEISIGNAYLMLGSSCKMWETKSAKELGGSPISFAVYVEDVDQAFDKAKKAGMIEKMPITEQFWGDRVGTLMDPFGIKWSIAQHVRDVSPEEMQAAMDKMCAA